MGFRRLMYLVSIVATVPCAQPAGADPTKDTQVALAAAGAAAQRNDCETALKVVAQQTAKPAFAKLTDEQRLFTYALGAYCGGRQGDTASALRFAEAGTAIPGADGQLWYMRFIAQWQLNRKADAIATVETMAKAHPQTLNLMPGRLWGALYHSLLVDKEAELRRRLLIVITAPGFSLPEPDWSTDRYRRDYAAVLSEGGDKAGAVAQITQITDPSILIEASVDRRLRALIPADFDARGAVERDMARVREVAAAHANALGPQIQVAEHLLMLGKVDEAIATLDAIDPQKATFNDQADQLAWWWNAKADALSRLGRYEQAVDAFKRGQALSEAGRPNISQTINLAGLQSQFGHHADALATLAPVREGKIRGSEYGMMAFHKVQGCANFRLGKIEDAAADLKYAVQHANDGPTALTALQLCMKDVEGAASSIIKRLETPDDSAKAMLLLSDFIPRPSTSPGDPGDELLAHVKARADVQAAIARAGGVRSFNVVR